MIKVIVKSLALCAFSAFSFLLSSSEILKCDRTHPSDTDQLVECDTKAFLLLSLENFQMAGTETMALQIESIAGHQLTDPVQILVSKSQVLAQYPLIYIQNFNYYPREAVLSSTFFSCDDGHYDESPSCGWAYSEEGQKIPDSQGFCCTCGFDDFLGLGDDLDRGKTCQALNLGEGSSTAHCLRLDELWLAAFEIRDFFFRYELNIDISYSVSNSIQNITSQNTTRLSLSNSQQVAKTDAIIAKIPGHLYPNSPPESFENLILLVPHSPPTHTLVRQGTAKWMVIPRDLFSFDGTECNKVGTSYSAFTHQTNRCQRPVGTCLGRQPFHLLEEDLELIAQGKEPYYLLKGRHRNFNLVEQESSLFLADYLQGTFSTLLTLQIDGKLLHFTVNIGDAFIESIEVKDFESMSGDGKIDVIVRNNGTLLADFSLSISNCTTGLLSVDERRFSLPPQESKILSFQIYTTQQSQTNHSCTAFLLNSEGGLLQKLHFAFVTYSTNITLGAQGGEGPHTGDFIHQPYSASSCQQKCSSWFDVFCFLIQGCFVQVLRFVVILILICVAPCLLLKLICCCLRSAKRRRSR